MNEALEHTVVSARAFLLAYCVYALTPCSVNPNIRVFFDPFKGVRFIFFTNISLYITILTTILLVVYRIRGKYRHSSEKSRSATGSCASYKEAGYLRALCNFCLGLSAVCNMMTTVIFWTLYFIDKKLIISANSLRPGCGTYLLTELSLHLFPLTISMLEQLDFRLKRTYANYIAMVATPILWGIALTIVKHYRKHWPYSFMRKMSVGGRIFFFTGAIISCLVLYQTLLAINRKICMK